MADESINDDAFYLKPGGVKEDASPTELNAKEYSQVSGFDDLGATTRMPGKRLVTRYAEPVRQIAGFGGAVIIQHGPNLIIFPDACACVPVPEEYTPPPVAPPVTSGTWVIDLPNSVVTGPANARLTDVAILKYNGSNSSTTTTTFICEFREADMLVDPTQAGTFGLPTSAYKQLDFTEAITISNLIGTLWYLVVSCEYTRQDGKVLSYACSPTPFPAGSIELNGGAEIYQLVIFPWGPINSANIYSNVTGMTQPYTMAAYPASDNPA